MKFDAKTFTITLILQKQTIQRFQTWFEKRSPAFLFFVLSILSIVSFLYYLSNGLGVAYNDARSHLDIGRRVVENLTPGFAQLGSVWLPLPHLLMALTIWNDFMWHSGLSGALLSMASFVATGLVIYQFLRHLNVSLFGRIVGVIVFALNINIIYMQSTAMTELLLLATMTIGVYELMLWHREETILRLIKAAFWIMLSTLIRYDGWFLFALATGLVLFHCMRRYGYKTAEGVLVLFITLGGFGIFLWLLWNQMIFKDALYFAFGPYSASAQQNQLEAAGVLATKYNFFFSIKTYFYAMVYNSSFFLVLLSFFGAALLWLDRKISFSVRVATLTLLAPFFFNVIALYLGHSVLYVQGLSGESWFNVRYGLMMVPSIAIFVGYLVYRVKQFRLVLLGLILFISFFMIANHDAVTIDDAKVGSSGKNVTEVSGWLKQNVPDKDGYVLISAASHDAIIFSSDLPMKRFIHEGTGDYWEIATAHPDRYVRWIILRTHDTNDLTFSALRFNKLFTQRYQLVNHFPFADIYELKPEFVDNLRMLPAIAEIRSYRK